MDSMGPGEIGVLGAVCIYVIDRLFKFIPKTKIYTEEDVKQMKFDSNMKGTLDTALKLLEKLSDKGDQREKILDDIKVTGDSNHKRIGQIESHLDVFKRVLAKD